MKTIKQIRQEIKYLSIEIAATEDNERLQNLEIRILRLELAISDLQLSRARKRVKKLKAN